VDDKLRAHLGNEEELALAELGGVEADEVLPEGSRFAHDEADVLWAFLHLAG
jgi:hypothetical protein